MEEAPHTPKQLKSRSFTSLMSTETRIPWNPTCVCSVPSHPRGYFATCSTCRPPCPQKAQGGKMAMREVSSRLGRTLILLPAGRCSFTTGPNWGTARGGDGVEGAAGISRLSEHSPRSGAARPSCRTRRSDSAWVAEGSAVRTAMPSPGHIPGCLLALPHFSQCLLSSSRSSI